MAQRPGTVQMRARRTRARICAAAAKTFEAHGFAGTTLGAIRDELGITNGALYFHFSSKQELAAEIIGRQRTTVTTALQRIDAGDSTALIKLTAATFALSRLLAGNQIVRAGVRLSLDANDGPELDGIATPIQDWTSWTVGHVAQARVAGEIADGVGVETLGRFLLSSLIGAHLVSTALTDGTDLEQQIEGMWRVLLPGVLARDHAPPIDRILEAGSAVADAVTP